MPIEDKEAFDRSIFAQQINRASYAKILGILVALMEAYGNSAEKKMAAHIDRVARSKKIPDDNAL